MKKVSLIIAFSFLLIGLSSGSSNAAAPRPGTACSKLNQTQVLSGLSFTCMKVGKKLMWGKGVKVVTPSTPSSASPNFVPSQTPSPDPSVLQPSAPGLAGPGSALTLQTPIGLDANWVGTSVVVTWNFDTSVAANSKVNQFEITLTPDRGSPHTFYYRSVNRDSQSQTFTLSSSDNATYFGKSFTFTNFSVVADDAYGHESSPATLNKVISYRVNLPKPDISVTALNHGYQVTWSDIRSQYPSIQYLSVEDVISNSPTDPGIGYHQVYLDSGNPATILTSGLEKRWVRARFSDSFGAFGDYSVPLAVL